MLSKMLTHYISNIKFILSHLPFALFPFAIVAGGCSAAPAVSPGENPSVSAAPSGVPEDNDTVTPLPDTPTLTPVPSDTPLVSADGYSADAAAELIRGQLVPGRYDITLFSDSYQMDSEQYYTFVISKNGNTIEPLVLVGQELGDLWCISGSNTVSDISGHPLYHSPDQQDAAPKPTDAVPENSPTQAPVDVEDNQPDQENITAEEALTIFRGLTTEQTGLSQLLDNYLFYIPEQTEDIMNHTCYTILVYSNINSRLFLDARFYMTLDGSTIYKQAHASDDLEIFSLKNE